MSHTHAGRIVRPESTGHRWRNGHLGGRARIAPVHALTAFGSDYRALCGAIVLAWYGNADDLDGPITGHVRPVGELAVTCERCRKILETQRHRDVRLADGRVPVRVVVRVAGRAGRVASHFI